MSGPCKWCPTTIFWKQTETGFVPYEDEARTKIHDCPNKPGAQEPATNGPAKPVKVAPLTDGEILFVRKWKHFVEELQPK